jgi:hypothetical protein
VFTKLGINSRNQIAYVSGFDGKSTALPEQSNRQNSGGGY